jgi:hypothetical protein
VTAANDRRTSGIGSFSLAGDRRQSALAGAILFGLWADLSGRGIPLLVLRLPYRRSRVPPVPFDCVHPVRQRDSSAPVASPGLSMKFE